MLHLEREHVCAFTGHRDSKLPWGTNENDPCCKKLKTALYDAAEAMYAAGRTHFICGMATGCDLYFAEAVIALRTYYPEVTLEAAIPYEKQSQHWAPALRRRYARVAAECDYQTVVQMNYTSDCYMRRNRYMVDCASALIAAYDGRSGGTMNTLLYAIRQGLEIVEIAVDL